MFHHHNSLASTILFIISYIFHKILLGLFISDTRSSFDSIKPSNGAVDGSDKKHPGEGETDFVETNCHWQDCNKEFDSQDELVKVRQHSTLYNLGKNSIDSI